MSTAATPPPRSSTESPQDKDLAQQIFEVMLQAPARKQGFRPVHAKGIVGRGTFEPSTRAAAICRAAHFQGPVSPLTVRFSDGSSDPGVADNSDDAGPRGIAIRFHLPGDGLTDIVAMSHNGFVVGTGEDFLALQKAAMATDPSKPHPWPIEQFLGTHPLALKFVMDNRVIPASLAMEAFFSNNSFVLLNQRGARQTVRYQIVPASPTGATSPKQKPKLKSANFYADDLKSRLASAPVQYRLIAQLPNAGDPTHDPSLVWPDDRQTVELGLISIASIVPDSARVERDLIFDPTHLADGIELSDDPLPALRAKVYSLSYTLRHQTQA